MAIEIVDLATKIWGIFHRDLSVYQRVKSLIIFVEICNAMFEYQAT